jgi:hypothetical protein
MHKRNVLSNQMNQNFALCARVLPKKGRGQKEENIIFALCLHGLKPLNLFMKKRQNMYFQTRSARNTTSLFNPLNLFMGFPFCLQHSCPLPSQSPLGFPFMTAMS